MKRGSRSTQGYYGGHVRQNIVGAVNRQNDQLVRLIVPHSGTKFFQALLDTMAQETKKANQDGRRICLVLDNPSWHKAKWLIWHHIEPIYLPPTVPIQP